MSGLGGLLGGLLGLTLLDAGLQAATSNKWLGELPVDLAKGLDYWLARDQPLLSRPCNSSSSIFGISVGGASVSVGGSGGDSVTIPGLGSASAGGAPIPSGVTPFPTSGAAGAHAVTKAANPATIPSGITLA